ncbi:hypothetical protein ABZT03_44225 [Streptomyces sp. NPDC005574]|uniref:hypothetical protein n=1 Tax=Streptomyces sp. NPDC005574 TaxID=3156891 RepID=UPI0033AAF541
MIRRLAALISPAVAVAAVIGGPGIANASTTHCLQGATSTCITVRSSGATHFINVTGTSGNDTILFKILPPPTVHDLPSIGVTDAGGVHTFNTNIGIFLDNVITVNGVNGNDTISLAGLNSTGRIYSKATLQSGRGNSNLTASNQGENVLIGGPGQNFLSACNGRFGVGTVQGSGKDTAQVDDKDKVTGVTKTLPCPKV